jgi:hypothetical protein
MMWFYILYNEIEGCREISFNFFQNNGTGKFSRMAEFLFPACLRRGHTVFPVSFSTVGSGGYKNPNYIFVQ